MIYGVPEGSIVESKLYIESSRHSIRIPSSPNLYVGYILATLCIRYIYEDDINAPYTFQLQLDMAKQSVRNSFSGFKENSFKANPDKHPLYVKIDTVTSANRNKYTISNNASKKKFQKKNDSGLKFVTICLYFAEKEVKRYVHLTGL